MTTDDNRTRAGSSRMRCPSRFIGPEFKRSAAGENSRKTRNTQNTHRRSANQKSQTEIKAEAENLAENQSSPERINPTAIPSSANSLLPAGTKIFSDTRHSEISST